MVKAYNTVLSCGCSENHRTTIHSLANSVVVFNKPHAVGQETETTQFDVRV